jgi:hypothetical protein
MMEAEFTRFRDIEFSPLRARVAAMESIENVPSSGIAAFKATQEGYPNQEALSHSNLPWESVDPKGHRGRAALVSRVQITTRKTSTRKPSQAPMTGSQHLMTWSPGRAMVSRASPFLGWRKSSLPDRTTRGIGFIPKLSVGEPQ